MNEQQTTEGVVQEQGTTPRQIILKQLEKCVEAGSKEWVGGYWEKKPINSGGSVHLSSVWMPDTRESFANSVNRLIDLLFPYFDSRMKKDHKETQKKIEEKFKKLSSTSSEDKTDEYLYFKARQKAKLFRHISEFLARIKYFEKSGGTKNE